MPPDVPEATSDLVKQLQDNARGLGLVWVMRKATVAAGANVAAVTAVMDGDTVAVSMISMVGPLRTASRVWVLSIPSGGNYITGTISGGASNYSQRQTLTATAASVTFTGIPSAGLRRLRISYMARADNATTVQFTQMRVNGDATGVYFYQYGLAQNAAFAAAPGSGTTSAIAGLNPAASAALGVYGSGQIELVGWDDGGLAGSSRLNYTFVSQAMGPTTATFTTAWGGGFYSVARPYTSLTLFPQTGNWVAGSDFQLEGWPS